MKNWYIIIDIAKCENCNNCFLACKDEHAGNDWPGYAAPQPDHGPKWMNLSGKERGQYPFIDVAYLPSPCMHCGDAPCMKAAKDNAVYRREDGIVIIDPVKAKGQKNIVAACPYHAVWWNEELQIPQKCTMCAHLLDSGWTKTRCVQACPTGALSMLHEEPEKIKELIANENLESYLPEYKTMPHVLYKNLYRYTRCFIGGSIAYTAGDKEECAEGAKVTLLDTNGKTMGEQVTDNYGDFKFDNLPENSGRYTLTVSFKHYPLKTVPVDLHTSVYTGVIRL